MNDVMRVGVSALRYRGGPNQWAWAIHRVAGLGVFLFLALHIADIFVAAFGATVFNDLLFLYKGPPARILEIFQGIVEAIVNYSDHDSSALLKPVFLAYPAPPMNAAH